MVSSNTAHSELEAALGTIPERFRKHILEAYSGLKDAYLKGEHDTAGLRVGKFCEALLRYLQTQLTGTCVPFGTGIRNLPDECRKLERLPATAGTESFRVVIPRAIVFAYTLRNKRGIGHVGGDVDANEIDSSTMVRIVDWCLCELIRVVHTMSLEEAQQLLDAISFRELPIIWTVAGKKRILTSGLTYREQTLVLLYGEKEAIPIEDLVSWTDNPNATQYRNRVLLPLHRERLIEFDQESGTAQLSPKGAEVAESGPLKRL